MNASCLERLKLMVFIVLDVCVDVDGNCVFEDFDDWDDSVLMMWNRMRCVMDMTMAAVTINLTAELY